MIILVASYCHNTTVIHEDFKKFLKIENNNNSNMLSAQKKYIFWGILIDYYSLFMNLFRKRWLKSTLRRYNLATKLTVYLKKKEG